MKFLQVLSIWFLSTTCLFAGDPKHVVLTSLDWPPYTAEKIMYQGATAAVVKEAFNAMGYTVEFRFYPWNRAVKEAKDNPLVDGYFPEYKSDDVAKTFLYSDSIDISPLGFVENKNNPIQWRSIDNLFPLRVGVVSGYVNTKALDDAIAQKRIHADISSDDITVLRKVAAKRLDLGVIDSNVMAFLLGRLDKDELVLKKFKADLQFNGKMLEDKTLHICFKKTPRGEELRQILNAGLKKVDSAAVEKGALKDILGRIH